VPDGPLLLACPPLGISCACVSAFAHPHFHYLAVSISITIFCVAMAAADRHVLSTPLCTSITRPDASRSPAN
jgi:hypothetical protein